MTAEALQIEAALTTLRAIEERVCADSAQQIGLDGGVANPAVQARVEQAVLLFVAQKITRS